MYCRATRATRLVLAPRLHDTLADPPPYRCSSFSVGEICTLIALQLARKAHPFALCDGTSTPSPELGNSGDFNCSLRASSVTSGRKI